MKSILYDIIKLEDMEVYKLATSHIIKKYWQKFPHRYQKLSALIGIDLLPGARKLKQTTSSDQ